jgi:hypothetical protein
MTLAALPALGHFPGRRCPAGAVAATASGVQTPGGKTRVAWRVGLFLAPSRDHGERRHLGSSG